MLRNSFHPALGARDKCCFFLHVPPDDFMRILRFGYAANLSKKQTLTHCRKLLGLHPALPELPKRSAHGKGKGKGVKSFVVKFLGVKARCQKR